MRILTWNLWHRFGRWQDRGRAIAAVLADAQPDVLCLQEVWTHDERSQAGQLGEAIGLPHVVDAHRVSHDGVTFGNAIVSRWPIQRHEVRPLTPHRDYEELRTVVGARAATPAGVLHVFTTHLNFMLDQSAVRQAQVRDVAAMVLDWRRERPDLPEVVAGDLNAEPDSDEVRMLVGKADLGLPLALLDAWVASGQVAGQTWSRRNPLTQEAMEPDRRIDYVLTGMPRDHEGRGRVRAARLVGTRPVDGVWASDHFGVLVELDATSAPGRRVSLVLPGQV